MVDEPTNVVQFVPAGKVRCYITGKLRPDKPEEHVRQRWARSLVEEYGYDRADIEVEFRIRIGATPGGIDLAIFEPGVPHKQENVRIVVETKRAEVKPTDKDNGVGQLKSYMSACSRCRHGVWVASEKLAYRRLEDGTISDDIDIPRFGHDEPVIPQFHDLVPALDLKATLHRCHNYIYVNQGLQKAEAFHELVKLIFAKVHDETESSGPLRFYVQSEERRSIAGQRRLLEERVGPLCTTRSRNGSPTFFPQARTSFSAAGCLPTSWQSSKGTALLATQTDIKGAAYEELVGGNLRGTGASTSRHGMSATWPCVWCCRCTPNGN